MRKVICDRCGCDVKVHKSIDNIEFLEEAIDLWVEIEQPDFCFNCMSDLEASLKETTLNWKKG